MATFFENDPTLQNYWRAIILYGQNVASYKFALAKALIDLKKNPNDLIKLEELAVPFSNHICEHLKHNEKQITSESSKFLDTLKKFNNKKIELNEKNEVTVKLGFNNVTRTIDHSELFIRAFKGDFKDTNYLLNPKKPPYWFQHHKY